MREVIFRGKRLDNKEWVYGGVTSTNHTIDAKAFIFSNRFYEGQEDDEHFEQIEVDPDTVGQFSGLYDEDGKHIFEDDILCVIVENDEPCYSRVLYEDGCFCDEEIFLSETAGESKVAGNIHDHAHLLNPQP